MAEKFWENFETIDNETINKNIDKLNSFIEKRLENEEILKILNKIDWENPDKDIDMAYNPNDKKYYIKINGEINPKWLSFEELKNRFPVWLSPKEINKLSTKENKYSKYIDMDKKDFLKEIHQMDDLTLENLLTEIETILIDSENSEKITNFDSGNKIRELKHKAEDIRQVYYEKTWFPIPWEIKNWELEMVTPIE